MLYNCYLRNGIVYVPTVGRRGGAYADIEPVMVVPVGNSEGLRRAFLDVIAKKNVAVALLMGKRPLPVVLKHAGVQSWSTFARNALTWNIIENEGTYKIVGHRLHSGGYWVEDKDRKIEFPPETTLDMVIDCMITILQAAAAE
jgi:hypothetical protein